MTRALLDRSAIYFAKYILSLQKHIKQFLHVLYYVCLNRGGKLVFPDDSDVK